MSNALAVPTVTACLVTLLQTRIDAANVATRTTVKAGSLDDDTNLPLVGVHLYRIDRNASLAADDLPTRPPFGGALRQVPRTVLELHYLLTFRGQSSYQSEQLLALCAAALHATPEVFPDLIDLATAGHPDITGNDLARAQERVRIRPESLSIDELTRIWALYQPGAFALSLAFVAGPVVVESPEVAGTVLPVLRTGLGARVLNGPRLDTAAGPDGVGAPVRATSPMPDLRLFGSALAPLPGETLKVLVDGAPAPATVLDAGQLTVSLTGVRPGVHTVQVLRLTAPLDPTVTLTAPALASAPVAFTVLPTLGAVTATPAPGAGDYQGTLAADVLPALTGSERRVRLLLDRVHPDATVALALDVTPAPQSSISVPLTDTPRGDYRVTLEVDGARSLPPLDLHGLFLPQEVTL
ncbi:Pvc16 family protein [Kitasatospora sp. NPDC085464]|uniref:Pvc16 family protein n=1 Tax=Kitasatospora sp. NPDC085464 TaxID=3364063 RepID=UPI0037CA118E